MLFLAVSQGVQIFHRILTEIRGRKTGHLGGIPASAGNLGGIPLPVLPVKVVFEMYGDPTFHWNNLLEL